MMTTLDKDILIANFMGWTKEKHESNFFVPVWRLPAQFRTIYENGWQLSHVVDERLQFSFNWTWLMPVIDKIEDTKAITESFNEYPYCVEMSGGGVRITADNGYTEPKINHHFRAETRIENAYNSVVEFIEWYNEQNKVIL